MGASTRPASRRAVSSTTAGDCAPPPAHDGWVRLQHGLALALDDLRQGRDDLRAALAAFDAASDHTGRLTAAASLLLFIGIADDHYDGFEPAVEAVAATRSQLAMIADADHRLLARGGALVAGWFRALDDPQLGPQAEAITRALSDRTVSAAARCCAGLAALAYFVARFSLDGVLWVELAMREVLAEDVSPHLAEEWHHALVQALYECAAPQRADAERAKRGNAPLSVPAIELKRQLAQAQIAVGEGRVDAGRAALDAAEPLLHPRAPRPASWWHLLHSRLDLIQGRHREALTHARLALRLATESRFPDRWMGVTVMQEGQVQMASGAYALAVPFFERAGRAAAGPQADFCWCLAHFARALAGFESAGGHDLARAELVQGLQLAQRMHWLHFFRACPRVAAQICALGLEHQIEPAFVREVITARSLDAVRPDLSAWPWAIRVRTLGRFQIELAGTPLAFGGKVARKPLELLQFIIASGGSDVSATTVMFALWRELEGDKAKSAFNVALHRLRKLLASDDAILLELGRLSLNPKLVWVDCLAFEQLIDGAGVAASGRLTPAAAADMQRAVALYAGHFLHETEDEPWQMVCRSRLASKFKRSVGLLARHGPGNGSADLMRALLEHAIELDPMAEDLARELMQRLSDGGEQAAALNVFARCKAAISRGLGAAPAAATLALVERIRSMR